MFGTIHQVDETRHLATIVGRSDHQVTEMQPGLACFGASDSDGAGDCIATIRRFLKEADRPVMVDLQEAQVVRLL